MCHDEEVLSVALLDDAVEAASDVVAVESGSAKVHWKHLDAKSNVTHIIALRPLPFDAHLDVSNLRRVLEQPANLTYRFRLICCNLQRVSEWPSD